MPRRRRWTIPHRRDRIGARDPGQEAGDVTGDAALRRDHARRGHRHPGAGRAERAAWSADRVARGRGGGAVRGRFLRRCRLDAADGRDAGPGPAARPAAGSFRGGPLRGLLCPLDHLGRAALRARERDHLRPAWPTDLRRGDRPVRIDGRDRARTVPDARRRARPHGGRRILCAEGLSTAA